METPEHKFKVEKAETWKAEEKATKANILLGEKILYGEIKSQVDLKKALEERNLQEIGKKAFPKNERSVDFVGSKHPEGLNSVRIDLDSAEKRKKVDKESLVLAEIAKEITFTQPDETISWNEGDELTEFEKLLNASDAAWVRLSTGIELTSGLAAGKLPPPGTDAALNLIFNSLNGLDTVKSTDVKEWLDKLSGLMFANGSLLANPDYLAYNASMTSWINDLRRAEEGIPPSNPALVFEIRKTLSEIETKGVGSRTQAIGYRIQNMLDAISDPNLREQLKNEMDARETLDLMEKVWVEVSGDEKKVGGLIERPLIEFPDVLINLSNLADSHEIDPEFGRQISTSWMVSRSMNLVVNFLGKWAEGLDTNAAQAELVSWRLDPARIEGVPLYLENNGLKRDVVLDLIDNKPSNLANYNPAFRATIAARAPGSMIPLREVFGKNPLFEPVGNLDSEWAQHVIAYLSGVGEESYEAERIARRVLHVTGELGELNTVWADSTWESGDVQKLMRPQLRRDREASKGRRHGPDYTINNKPPNDPFYTNEKYPDRLATGWMRNAKFENRHTIFQELRDGIPFHRNSWGELSKDTIKPDFHLQLFYSFQVFEIISSFVDAKNFVGDEGKDTLGKLQKAFTARWPEYDSAGNKIIYSPLMDPKVLFVLGAASGWNPKGKQLPGMREKPPKEKRIPIGLSHAQKIARQDKPTWNEVERTLTGQIPDSVIPFFTKEQMDIVNGMFGIGPLIPGTETRAW